MSLITLDVYWDSLDGLVLAKGAFTFTPKVRRDAAEGVVLPAGVTVILDGVTEQTVELADTSSAWCWVVTEAVSQGGSSRPRFVEVTTAAKYSALVQVDPASLDPLPAAGTVAEAIAEAQSTADAAIPASEKGVTVPTLTDGRVPEAQLPANLSAESLNSTYGTRGRWPVVTITTDSGADPVSKETYIDAEMWITDTDGGAIYNDTLRIRGRGSSTWQAPKKPWRLNLDHKAQLLGMTANQKNWALLADYYDPGKINGAFAFEAGYEMPGLTWTPEYRPVELVMNGTYRGIYRLADLVRMEEGRLPGEVPDEDAGSGVTGTYLLEACNKEAPGETAQGTDPGFWTSRGNWILWDTPADGEMTAAQSTYIRGHIDDFETALFSADFMDAELGWRAFADEESFADWYLMNEGLRNIDSWMWSSCKMFKPRDGLLHMGPLWDFDLSLGTYISQTFSAEGFHTRTGDWFARLWQDTGFRALLSERWELFTDALGDYAQWLDLRTDAQTPATERDGRRWEQSYYSPLEADRRKRFIADRLVWLSAQVEATNLVPATVTVTV